MSEALLSVSGLSAGYLGENVVHDVALSLAVGDVAAVIGSNGAGKTTMLRAMCGLLPASAGTVRFNLSLIHI